MFVPPGAHGHRGMVAGRLPEMLDGLKNEFESLAHDVNMYKMQKEEYEMKFQQQLTEMSNMQSTIYELEKRANELQRVYKEEIARLQSITRTQTSNMKLGMDPDRVQIGNAPRTPPSASDNNKRLAPPMSGGQAVKRLRTSRETELPSNDSLPLLENLAQTAISTRNNGKFMQEEFRPLPIKDMSASASAATIPAIASTLPVRDHLETSARDQSSSNVVNSLSLSDTGSREQMLNPSRIRTLPSSDSITSNANNLNNNSNNMDDDMDSEFKASYFQNVRTNLEVDLAHTIQHDSVVCCVRFSHDGKYLATGSNRKAQIYSVEDGSRVQTFVESQKPGDLYLRSVCFSPDGQYLACGAEDKTIKLWSIKEEKIVHVFEGHSMDIYSLDFSADSRYIVSGSGDKKAKIWDVEKRRCLFTLGNDEVGPKDGVTSVAISGDGRLVAAGSLDRIVRLWDAQTGYFLERYEGHNDSVYSVAFSPDGKSLASGSLDKTLKLWDLSETRSRSRCRYTFTGHSDFVLSVAFSPDGNWLISGSKDSSVQFWDPRTALAHLRLEGHRNSVISVAVSPGSGYFATGSGDLRAKIWKYNNTLPVI